MCLEVGIIKRQYLLGGLISLRVVEQAGQCLEVAFELFYSDKKTDVSKPGLASQCVCDVVLEGLARVMTEHLQQVKHDALVEQVPTLVGVSRCVTPFTSSQGLLVTWAFIIFSHG